VIARYNHPPRAAECIATLDLLSDGRVDFGIGEGATRLELGRFGIPVKKKRAVALEAAEQIAGEGAGQAPGIGTPEELRRHVRGYQRLSGGRDQTGRNRHEHICAALDLFAAKVMPGFKAAAAVRETAKGGAARSAYRRCARAQAAPPPAGG